MHPLLSVFARVFRDDETWSRALAAAVGVSALLLSLFAGVRMLMGQVEWGHALVGGLCTAVVTTPYLLTRLSVLSLWGPVTLVVTIGTGVRGLAMATRWPDPARIDAIFLRGQSFSDLVWPAVVTLASVTMVTLGYVLARRWRPAPGERRHGRLDLPVVHLSRRTRWGIVAAYALVGAFGTAMYFISVGGLGGTVNTRRTVYDGTPGFQSHGHWEYLAEASTVALLAYLAMAMLTHPRLRLVDWAVLAVLAVNTFAINIITTTRTDLIYVTLGILFLAHVVRRRIPPTVLVTCAVLVLVGIGTLSAVRAVSGGGSLVNGISSSVLNRNGYDLSKSMVVTDAVPEQLPYAYGATMARYVLAPVPRVLWPEKPAISEGVTIGREIYGLERTGVPPGLTGELVWNFGRFAAVGLSLLVGLLLGAVERFSLRSPRTSLTALLAGALVILPFGKAVMGVSLGQASSAAAQTLLMLAPLFCLAWFGARHRARHRAT